MSGTNEYLAFGTAPGANVLPAADWDALAARENGFSAGLAKSVEVNTALRQSSVVAAALAQWLVDRTGDDALDDGNSAALVALLDDSVSAAGAMSSLNYTPASGGTQTRTLSFTPPCSGKLLVLGAQNVAQTQPIGVDCTIGVNGSPIAGDNTLTTISLSGVVSVVGGVAQTITLSATAGVTGSAFNPVTMWLSYLFAPAS